MLTGETCYAATRDGKGIRRKIRDELAASDEKREQYAVAVDIRRRPRAEGGNPHHPLPLDCLQTVYNDNVETAVTHNQWILPKNEWRDHFGSKIPPTPRTMYHLGTQKACIVFHSASPPTHLVSLMRYEAATSTRRVTTVHDPFEKQDEETGYHDASLIPRVETTLPPIGKYEQFSVAGSVCAKTVSEVSAHMKVNNPHSVGGTFAESVATGIQSNRASYDGADDMLGAKAILEHRAQMQHTQQRAHDACFSETGTRAGAELPCASYYREILVAEDMDPFEQNGGAEKVSLALANVEKKQEQVKDGRGKAERGDDNFGITADADTIWLENLRELYKNVLRISHLWASNKDGKHTAEIMRLASIGVLKVRLVDK